MNVKTISDLFLLCGDFSLPTGEVELTDDGYRYVGEGYTATTTLKQHDSGVIRRCDCIQNTTDHDISLRAALSKFVYNGGEYEVYTQYSEWCNESIGAWQPLVSEVGASNEDLRMNSGSTPFVAIYNVQTGRGTAFHILADSTWRIRVKKAFWQAPIKQKNIVVELGINDRDFDYTLKAGETLKLPEILFYEFRNKLDMDAYKLHRYCNDVYPARSLPLVYNSWLSRGDVISYELLSDQLEAAKGLGVEYFVIDAGWFGAPGEWYGSVGDWEECTDCSMMGRMKEFADRVRAEGLRFGLWFEVERAATTAKAVANHPEHYITEGGNCFIDFSSEAACDYIYGIVSAQIENYGIEYIKFDFNAPISFDRNRHAFLDYFNGYRKFMNRLRAAYPSLYCESCASGGLRMALANLQSFDSFWMSDNHSLYAQLEIFKNTMIRMPCRALEHWLTIQSLDCIKGRTREKILSSGDAGWRHVEAVFDGFLKAASVGGPIGLCCDVTAFSETLRETVRGHFDQYKAEREFWMQAECRILSDTPTVLALQFNDKQFDTVKVFAFTKNSHQRSITVYPVLDESHTYCNNEGAATDGATIATEGFDFDIETNNLFDGYTLEWKKS